jgi:sarcosine oxidase subunit beta
VRGQWADPLNIELSWRSILTFQQFPEEHGIDIGYVASGYLFLQSAETWPLAHEAVALQREFGVPVEILDVDAALALTPFDPEGVAGITWGPADGAVDPHGLTTAYLDLARSFGAEVRYRAAVTAVQREGDGLRVTAGGDEIHPGVVVNAAGGWAGDVASLAGRDVPVFHSRRNIFAGAVGAFDRRVPMTIDMASGIFMRSEGERLLFGGPPAPEHLGYSTDINWPHMETLLERSLTRFPWLADLPLDRNACWAGTYEMSPDAQGILGRDPELPAWYNACGFSGHGFMQSPELGRVIAEDITEGAITSIDASPLRIERFATATDESKVKMMF